MIHTEYFAIGEERLRQQGGDPLWVVGTIPNGLSENDPADAVTQLDNSYQHGGGWRDFPGFTLVDRVQPNGPRLEYAGDPPTRAVAQWKLRDERIVLFEHAWVAVIQPDGAFRVSRMD
jgi:hypothetical protein